MTDCLKIAREMVRNYKSREFAHHELSGPFRVTIAMEQFGREKAPRVGINWPGCGAKNREQTRLFVQALEDAERIAELIDVLWEAAAGAPLHPQADYGVFR